VKLYRNPKNPVAGPPGTFLGHTPKGTKKKKPLVEGETMRHRFIEGGADQANQDVGEKSGAKGSVPPGRRVSGPTN